MFNDRSAKLRRRMTALENKKKQLQNWKSATSEPAIASLLSKKDLIKVERGVAPETIRLDKIAKAEAELVTLGESVASGSYL